MVIFFFLNSDKFFLYITCLFLFIFWEEDKFPTSPTSHDRFFLYPFGQLYIPLIGEHELLTFSAVQNYFVQDPKKCWCSCQKSAQFIYLFIFFYGALKKMEAYKLLTLHSFYFLNICVPLKGLCLLPSIHMNSCQSMSKMSSMRTAAKTWETWILTSLRWQKKPTSRWPGEWHLGS